MKSVLQFLGGALGWVAAQAGLLTFLPHSAQIAVSALAAVAAVLGIRNAAQTPPQAVDLLNRLGSGWKTILGAIIWALGTLASDPGIGTALGTHVGHTLSVVGGILTALGLYHAQAKAAP